MAKIVKEIIVDVAKRNLFQAIVAKQYDSNSRFLKVTLANEGEIIPVDLASVVTINAHRADGTKGSFAGEVNSDGTVTVPLTKWMLELDDTVKCDIAVIDAESRKLTSTSFELEVETAAYSDGEITEDENYDLLITLLANVANVTGACQTATEAANSAAERAEQAAKAANDAAGNGGTDGGYYTPAVDDSGNLTWTASKSDMPAVDGANIQGPKGDTGATGPQGLQGEKGDTGATGPAGADGKSAYQYAQDGGYTGTEAEFVAKMAEEIPAVDATLTQGGQAADAKATGDAINALSEEIANKVANVYIGPVQPTDGTLYWLDTSDSGGSGGETVTHTVTAALTNVSIDNTAESVNDGASFAAALTADEGYTLSNVSVTMGGADITNAVYANGNIYIASVTGDIVITAVAIEMAGEVTVYTITNNLLHATSDNSAVSVEENAAYTAKLTAETDYALETVTITMGGVDITSDVYADGVINIPAVTGDVVITATTVYAPTSPVFELAEPFTGTGSGETVLDYNIVDEDKTFSVAIDYSATPSTGIYVFGAGNGTNSLGIRGQGGYYWFAQSQYYKTAEIAYNKVTNKKVVLTYEKGSGNLLAHHVKTDGTAETITLAKGWTTGASSATAVNPDGTINDLKIYARVLDESEINAYLGVE